jgi:DNA-binding NarL/FixJ family response regulator
MGTARHVVVVEDESLLRDLIAQSLEQVGFVVSTAANAADAKRACLAADPDAVVVDVELGPGPNGFDFAMALSQTSPDVGIVFLTNLPDSRFVNVDPKALPKRVAYLRKSQLVDSGELVSALDAVLRDRIDTKLRHDLDAARPMAELSKKQISVLQLLAIGYSNTQIADKRGTSVRAVEGIVSRIFQALGIDVQAEGNARVEAARKFLQASGKAITEN